MTRVWRLVDLAPLQTFHVHGPAAGEWVLALWVPGTRQSWIAGGARR